MILDAVWKIKLFGGLQAIPLNGGSAVTRFRTRRAAALLAVLAFQIGQTPPTRDELIEVLWPYADPVAALARLAVELTSLRKQLEASGAGNGAVLIADRFTISLDPQKVIVDVADFEALLAKVRAAASPNDREERLVAAIASYAGPLLPQMDGEWIEPERERLARRFVDAVTDLVNLRLERADAEAAAEIARAALRRERLREPFYVLLSRCELAARRVPEAIRAIEDLRRMLRESAGIDELGVEAQRCESDARAMLAPARRDLAPTSRRKLSRGREASRELPLGTITLLATDIEGSTALGRSLGEEPFAHVLAGHHALLRAEFARGGGTEVKETGDGFWIAFEAAQAALVCALACHQAISAGVPMSGRGNGADRRQSLRIRIAIHVADLRYTDRRLSSPDGDADDQAGDRLDDDYQRSGSYRGLALHDLSRLLSATNGGQIFLSEAAEAVLRRDLPEGITLVDRGRFRLRDAPGPAHIFEAVWNNLAITSDSPPPNAPAVRTPIGLPTQFTRFFGRDREIAAISEALDADAARAS